MNMGERMNKIEITVERPNGQQEVVDMSDKLISMNKAILAQMREANQQAGRGHIVKAVVTIPRDNMLDIARSWNN